jgi:hypothetical protein
MERGEKTNPGGQLPRHKKSIETSETINDSLPALQAGRGERANVLRSQLTDTRSQIVLMEAKLRNLRQLKDRNELTNQRNLTRLEFMNGVKQRVRKEHEHKQRVLSVRCSSGRNAHSPWKPYEARLGRGGRRWPAKGSSPRISCWRPGPTMRRRNDESINSTNTLSTS